MRSLLINNTAQAKIITVPIKWTKSTNTTRGQRLPPPETSWISLNSQEGTMNKSQLSSGLRKQRRPNIAAIGNGNTYIRTKVH